MGDIKGFLKVKRRIPEHRPVCERIKDYREVAVLRKEGISQEQASRCMDCGTPFCNWACPLGNYIPEWNDFMFKEKWKMAYQLLQATNNFPEFTGRLCPAMCEFACVLGINDEPVTIRENELDIAEYAFKHGLVKPVPPKKRTNKKVAVIGSGPSGLACADFLNKMGHRVVVFEKNNKPGGILRYGTPDFKLEKRIIDRRLNILKKEGLVFKTGVNAGSDIKFSALQKEFDAIALTGGCSVSRNLAIKGRNLKNIHFAMDYLIRSNKYIAGEIAKEDIIDAKNKKVVVIGGGDTGADCVGVANRQGASCVVQIELLPQPPECRQEIQPWPLYPMILKTSTSHQEGATRQWAILTKEFAGAAAVKKILCVRVDFKNDAKGCPVISEVPGTEFEIEADMVILALGFIHPEHNRIVQELGLQLDERKNIKTDSGYMTSVPGIFSAGDMRTGQSLIVKAIADGRTCACHIDRFLSAKTNICK